MSSLALWLEPYLTPYFKNFERKYFNDSGDRVVDGRLKKYQGAVGPDEITINVRFGRDNAKEIRQAIAVGDINTLDMFGTHIAGRFKTRLNECRDVILDWQIVIEDEPTR